MQMMVNCCATDEDACTVLKMGFPELQSDDPDMNPDFCAMHGNVCSRRVACIQRPALCHVLFCGADPSKLEDWSFTQGLARCSADLHKRSS